MASENHFERGIISKCELSVAGGGTLGGPVAEADPPGAAPYVKITGKQKSW